MAAATHRGISRWAQQIGYAAEHLCRSNFCAGRSTRQDSGQAAYILSRVGLGSIDSISAWFGIPVSISLRSLGPQTHAGPAARTWRRVCINASVSMGSTAFRFRSEPPLLGDSSPDSSKYNDSQTLTSKDVPDFFFECKEVAL